MKAGICCLFPFKSYGQGHSSHSVTSSCFNYYPRPKAEGYRFSVVRPAVRPSGCHKFVGAISQRLLQI